MVNQRIKWKFKGKCTLTSIIGRDNKNISLDEMLQDNSRINSNSFDMAFECCCSFSVKNFWLKIFWSCFDWNDKFNCSVIAYSLWWKVEIAKCSFQKEKNYDSFDISQLMWDNDIQKFLLNSLNFYTNWYFDALCVYLLSHPSSKILQRYQSIRWRS